MFLPGRVDAPPTSILFARDFILLEIGLNPIFDERHLYKIEALEKTIAIPVETPLLNDLRLILFFLLLTLGLVIDRIRT